MLDGTFDILGTMFYTCLVLGGQRLSGGQVDRRTVVQVDMTKAKWRIVAQVFTEASNKKSYGLVSNSQYCPSYYPNPISKLFCVCVCVTPKKQKLKIPLTPNHTLD